MQVLLASPHYRSMAERLMMKWQAMVALDEKGLDKMAPGWR
jgi:hypothetical protein